MSDELVATIADHYFKALDRAGVTYTAEDRQDALERMAEVIEDIDADPEGQQGSPGFGLIPNWLDPAFFVSVLASLVAAVIYEVIKQSLTRTPGVSPSDAMRRRKAEIEKKLDYIAATKPEDKKLQAVVKELRSILFR